MKRSKKDWAHVKEVGARIRKTRKAVGLKQKDLAEDIGVKGHTVWRWEDGREMPNQTNLDRIADALGVPSRWLLRGGTPPPGLQLDGESLVPRRTEPVLTRDQQMVVLDELKASPKLKACWSIHIAGVGAHQTITRVYLRTFLEIAEKELREGASLMDAADRAGIYAINVANDIYERGESR